MADLKLIALEPEDLTIISAHLQDAVLRVADLAWMPASKRFAMVANRFKWDTASDQQNRNERSRTAFRLEHVLGAKVQGIDVTAKDSILSLMAVQFEPTDAPGGVITLVFAGDGAIRLTVECVEGELRDLSASWKTKSRPSHSILDTPNDGDADSNADNDASFNSDT